MNDAEQKKNHKYTTCIQIKSVMKSRLFFDAQTHTRQMQSVCKCKLNILNITMEINNIAFHRRRPLTDWTCDADEHGTHFSMHCHNFICYSKRCCSVPNNEQPECTGQKVNGNKSISISIIVSKKKKNTNQNNNNTPNMRDQRSGNGPKETITIRSLWYWKRIWFEHNHKSIWKC